MDNIVPTVPKDSGEEGNTKDSSPVKKQISCALHWDFTWNNYPVDWKAILDKNSSNVSGYVYGKEVGESGTPHIQGYIRFKTKCRPSGNYPKQISWRNIGECRVILFSLIKFSH